MDARPFFITTDLFLRGQSTLSIFPESKPERGRKGHEKGIMVSGR
jgi:hypothetical protein